MKIKDIDMPARGTFFSHIIVIVMLFILPELILSYANPRPGRWSLVMYTKSAAAIAVFYLNYYWVIGATLFGRKRRLWAYILWNLAIIVAVLALMYWLQHILVTGQERPHRHYHDRRWLFFSQFVVRDMVMLVLTIALAMALKLTDKWNTLERQNARLIAAQKEDELTGLKSQINPHFLFNTLNTIYSLIEVSPREAQDAVHTLSKMLRYVLYENPSLVGLDREIEFVRSYIDLMKMRLGEGAVSADIDVPAATEVQVAPLLMVTLLENAFKHGNTGMKDQPIEISVHLDTDGTLVCRTFNHFLPGKAKAEGGIGITNLRRRLALLYGDRATLSTLLSGDTYTATLTIKTNTAE